MIRADARSTETVSGTPVDSSLSAARTCAQRTRSDVQASIWARMGVVQDRAGVEIGVGIVMLRYHEAPHGSVGVVVRARGTRKGWGVGGPS
jgi:hypothetical protein